ncbi:MAG TPA: hypothetical protein VEQ59_03785 [Polyangiaceae bacterium]|nr:hypothetical protein [Polyangiaceae bacterium]
MIHSNQRHLGRRAFIGTLLAAYGAVRNAQADAPAVEVTAKLVEIPSKMPPDDLYDYAYVMRYQVQGGPLDKQLILVAHYKPLVPRAKIKDKMKDKVGGKLRSFNQGDVHKLKLSADLKAIWKGAIVDEYAATDRNSVRYWCLQADPA